MRRGKDTADHEKGGKKRRRASEKKQHALYRRQINEYGMSHLRKEGELSTET